jgi:hypothetical protein
MKASSQLNTTPAPIGSAYSAITASYTSQFVVIVQILAALGRRDNTLSFDSLSVQLFYPLPFG